MLICLITFLPFSLLSPSSLLKLPIVLIQKFCYHGNMTSLFNNVITPASQWSANTHFTLSITPFVTSHLRATYPAHFHLIDAMCLTMSFYCRQEFSCVAPFVSDLSAVSSSPLPFAQISACTLRTQGFSNFTFAVDMWCHFFIARLSFRLFRLT